MTVQSLDPGVEELANQADRALAAGNRAHAEALLDRLRTLAPRHPAALNADALAELHRGNAGRARELLDEAIAQDDSKTRYWVNLAGALRRLGAMDDEMKALDRVLALEPRHLFALLQKGTLLELQGKRKAAAKVFHNALQTIPPGATVPSSLRGLVEHAWKAVNANDAALERFLAQRLEPARSQQAGTDAERFDHCIGAFLGRKRVFAPQPTFLHYPKLPAWEFYPRAEFPWLTALERQSAVIRSEFEQVFAEDAGKLEPYIAYPAGVPLDQWAELNHSRRWSVFYLWRDGAPVEEHLARCPKTAQILRELPLLDVPGYAPTAFFSILDARSRIPAHSGVTNTRVIVHLPLVIPPNCGFRVGSQTREWQQGQAWVFDDSIEHEAWNDSEVPRAILIFDVWNPYLSAAERDLVREAVQGIKEYYRGEMSLSGSA